MRWIPIVLCFAFASVLGHGGERAPLPRDGVGWNDLAGMREELEGQTLELRDELIAAHMSFLSALEKALNEVEGLSPADARHPLAWARTEYLLETCFRLLESTGEYDAFLKATTSLRPVRVQPAPAVEIGGDDGQDAATDGGLVYATVAGRSLSISGTASGPVLVDAETGRPPRTEDGITARPRQAATIVDGAYVPLIRARAAWLRGLALERLGRTEEAGTEAAPLALIRNWAILGPLEHGTDASSTGGQSPDAIAGLMTTVIGTSDGTEALRWRPFSSADPLGRLFPGALYRGPGQKTIYAFALVHSPDNLPAVMRFGVNAGATASVNHLIARRALSSGLADPDQDSFPVWLRRGWNVVLIQTASTGDDWEVAARLTDPAGGPFPGYVAKIDAGNLAAALAEARRSLSRSAPDRYYAAGSGTEAGGISVLTAWLRAHPQDARGNFYLASILVAKRLMEGPNRFDRENIFRRALEASGGDPFFTLMAARSVDFGMDGPDREENFRLVLLRSAADKGAAAALVDIGRLYLDVMRQPRRAAEYAAMAQSVNPMSLRAGVLDYDVVMALGWEPVAGALLDNLVRRHPSAAPARLRLGRSALASGRYRQALSEFHAILGTDADNPEALDGAVVALGMLGQTSAALDLLMGHIRRFPYDISVHLKLAELYRALGRDDEARGVLETVLDLAADDPDALGIMRELNRAIAAGGRAEALPAPVHRQELDLTPSATPPANGWEYLYFQIDDHMDATGAIDRTVSFALRIYSQRAARMLRHLGFWLERDMERGSITLLDIIHPNGTRQPFSAPVDAAGNGRNLTFALPPLETGGAVEVEFAIRRDRAAFLGEYFGHIAPLAQQAPVRLSRYLFTSPVEKRVFFKAANGAPEAMEVRSADGREITRIWEMNDLPAFVPEPYSLGQDELVPCIQVSSFGNWDEFARWYWRLIGPQYHAPPELRLLAQRMGQGDELPMGKLDLAAAWIARNIVHREWEYGPYAFRPVNARSILSRLSADGKDRTLLLCLLAREYGLEAWPVLARLRNRRFAAVGSGELFLPLLDHFNHSLAQVGSGLGGTIFLDASNPYRPPGVMPSQLFGSPGVAVTPEGADMVFIPDGGAAACDWRENAELTVDEDGNVLWEEQVLGMGTAAEALRMRFRDASPEAEAWSGFLSSIGAVPAAVSDSFRDAPSSPALAAWSGRARLVRLAIAEDKRVVLSAPPLPGASVPGSSRVAYPLSLEDVVRQGERSHDLILPHGFRVMRKLAIRYPESWRLVNPPEGATHSYPFGTLSIGVESAPGSLAVDFAVEVPGHVVAAGDFTAFREMAAMAERWFRPELVWEKP